MSIIWKRYSNRTIIIVLILLAGCHLQPPEAQFFTMESQNVYMEPEAGKGIVYFLEEEIIGNVAFSIWGGDKKIGVIYPGTYFFYQALPGDHIFWSESDVKRFFSLKVEAGGKYFVYVPSDKCWNVPRANFSLAPEKIGAHAVKKLKYAGVTEK